MRNLSLSSVGAPLLGCRRRAMPGKRGRGRGILRSSGTREHGWPQRPYPRMTAYPPQQGITGAGLVEADEADAADLFQQAPRLACLDHDGYKASIVATWVPRECGRPLGCGELRSKVCRAEHGDSVPG